MNPFVNYQSRDIELPDGCKNLFDVLELARRKQAPPPEGMPDLESYLFRVLHSVAIYRFLLISSLDYQVNVTVGHHSKGAIPGTTLTLIVDCSDTAREANVGTLFGANDILPVHEGVATNERVTARILTYPIPTAAPAAAHLIAELLKRVYGLAADAKLNFYYSEDAA